MWQRDTKCLLMLIFYVTLIKPSLPYDLEAVKRRRGQMLNEGIVGIRSVREGDVTSLPLFARRFILCSRRSH